MKAKEAAWKIINLGGTPTHTALLNYGVPNDQAASYMQWYNSRRAGRFKKYVKRSGRKPCIMYGHNTAHR